MGASASASEVPSQTDTDWGRIWDAVPRSFPLPPGAAVAETGEGPASARFAVPADPVAVAAAIEPQLAGAGYVVTRTGPYEDGSFVLELKGVAGCRAQFTVAPFGANSEMTLLTVLFGAACPYG